MYLQALKRQRGPVGLVSHFCPPFPSPVHAEVSYHVQSMFTDLQLIHAASAGQGVLWYSQGYQRLPYGTFVCEQPIQEQAGSCKSDADQSALAEHTDGIRSCAAVRSIYTDRDKAEDAAGSGGHFLHQTGNIPAEKAKTCRVRSYTSSHSLQGL